MPELLDVAQRALSSVEESVTDLTRTYRGAFGYGNPVRVVPFCGYGRGDRVRVYGRVLSDRSVEDEPEAHVLRNLWHMVRRYKMDIVEGARLKITIEGQTFEVESDEDGYYDALLEFDRPLRPSDLVCHHDIELIEPTSRNGQHERHFTGDFQIPTGAHFGIISDIDDTIVHTGAAQLFKHVKTVMLNNALTRTPFCGVSAFYHGLRNEQDTPTNPIFYVSSSPTNLYELFVDFMEACHIPAGTIFLKDFSFKRGRLIREPHHSYKRDRVMRIFEKYPDMRFILVGDSGQEDAAIYQSIVEDFRDRVLAVYIRNVSAKSESRQREIRQIADDVTAAGTPMLLVKDSARAAEHALGHGWITPEDMERVRRHVANPELDAREGGLVGAPRPAAAQ